MTQRKNHEVDSWLARPDPSMRIVLIYGPDRGLVSERAKTFASSTGIALDDPFAVVRLDAGDVEADPGRLFDEAQTVSMFSDKRLIWIREAGAGKNLAEAVKTLCQSPPLDATILIEGGDLKKGAALRTGVEGAAVAMALPCYGDDSRALDGLMDDIFGQAGLRLSLAARSRLKALLGGDRMASRGELDKLALYCHGRAEITEDDVDQLIGDVSATSADDALNAALRGDLPMFQMALARFQTAGGNRTTLLLAALRQLQALQLLRADMQASGKTASAAVAAARPPLYFDRKAAAERALGRLSPAQFASLVERLDSAVLESRRQADLSDTIIERSLLALAALR